MSSKKRTKINNVKIFDIANKGQAIAKFNEKEGSFGKEKLSKE